MTYSDGWGNTVDTHKNQLEAQRDLLVERLENGEKWFTANPNSPAKMKHEDTWIELLHEYENVCKELITLPEQLRI